MLLKSLPALCVALTVAFASYSRLAPAADATEDVKKVFAELNAKFCADLAKGDAAAIAGRFMEKGKLMPPNMEAIDGRDKIQAFWQAAMDAGLKSAKIEMTDLEVSGNLACETGTYQAFGPGEQLLERGKYVVVWKKDGGAWKAHRDCWNSNEKRSE